MAEWSVGACMPERLSAALASRTDIRISRARLSIRWSVADRSRSQTHSGEPMSGSAIFTSVLSIGRWMENPSGSHAAVRSGRDEWDWIELRILRAGDR